MSVPESHDSYIEKKGMFYRCNLCNLTLNGLVQVRSHTSGNSHRLKVTKAQADFIPLVGSNNSVNVETLSLASTSSVTKKCPGMDSFIQMKGSIYECTICHVNLNSECQVMDHVSGTKHIKAKSAYTGKTNSEINFEMNTELDRALKSVSNLEKIDSIKIIKADEPIII